MADSPSSLITMRRSQDRADHREGIPMVLALVNEVGDETSVVDEAALADGAWISAAVDRLRGDLAPTLRDDDMGAVITVVRAASYVDVSA